MMYPDQYMIADEGFLKRAAVNFTNSSFVKNDTAQREAADRNRKALRDSFKRQGTTNLSKPKSKEHDAKLWVAENAHKIHTTQDNGNWTMVHLDLEDKSKEMQFAINLVNDSKKNFAWGNDIPFIMLGMKSGSHENIFGILATGANWTDVVYIGVPVLSVSKPIPKILESLENGKPVKFDFSVLLEVHWSREEPTEVCTKPLGKIVSSLYNTTVEYK